MKLFNVAGPCNAADHYMIRPDGRLPGLERLIEERAYFVVHAPRQTGKTTTLLALAHRLTAEGRYAAVHLSVEAARAFPDEVAEAERAVLSALESAAVEQLPAELCPPARLASDPGSMLANNLKRWAETCPRPLVLILDEIDGLEGNPLRSLLSQLRAHFPSRPAHFPSSVILAGMRDVRDYKLASGGGELRAGSSSPFNIKAASLRLGNFTRDELRALYAQHTEATGQVFTEEALEAAWTYTEGQPWLCNALAREVLVLNGVAVDRPVTVDQIHLAKERLILARATHLDSLLARLKEERVRAVLEPILAGELVEVSPYDDDYQYVVDLGLIRPELPPTISNPLYREVIARVLAGPAETVISAQPESALHPSGRLDMPRLMADFAQFWREHGEVLVTRMPYPEAAPMLVLMAWLHRAINGKGRIEREVGVGRKRIDLLLRWPYQEGGRQVWQTEALELKVWRDRDRRGDPEPAGLGQLDTYLSRLGLDAGWLVVFDARAAAPDIDTRTVIREGLTPAGRVAHILRA